MDLSDKPRTQPTLLQDSRGAVLVLGLALAILLVAALWFLIDVSQAIIWRETAQDAADAVAFEHAVWSARGMNVIVMLNIVMSLVMFVMVVWRTALVVLGIVILATLPEGLLLLPVAEQLLMLDHRTIAPTVIRIVSALNAAEMGVATAAPVLAVVQSTGNTSDAYGLDTSAFSTALLPKSNVKGVQTAIKCLSGGRNRGGNNAAGSSGASSSSSGSASSSTPAQGSSSGPASSGGKPVSTRDRVLNAEQLLFGRMGMPVSLPVQDDSFSLLCNKGGAFGLNNMAGALEDVIAFAIEQTGTPGARTIANTLVLPVDLARNATGFITGLLPGVFCAPLGDAPISLSGVVKGLPSGARGRLFDAFNKVSAAMPETSCGKPAKTWEFAGNGNFFLRSFGSSELPASVQQEVGLTGDGDAGLFGGVPPDANSATAHAEMFLDCEGPWGLSFPVDRPFGSGEMVEDVVRNTLPGQACGLDAMWKMRWQARLRRVHSPGTLVGSDVRAIINGALRQSIKNVPPIFPGTKSNWWQKLPNQLSTPIATWAVRWLSGTVSSALEKLLRSGFTDATQFVGDDVLGGDAPTVGEVADYLRPQRLGQRPDELKQFLTQHRDRSAVIH
jgi:hypothetical protein